MDSWVFNLAICLGLIFAAYICLQSDRMWMKRLGLWLLLTCLGAGVWFISGSWALVATAITAWFAIPVGQAAYLSRTLRFSKDAALTPGTLHEDDPDELPGLQTLTNDLREEDFVLDQDYWLEPSPVRHGFRLFRHREKPICAAISVIKQSGMSLLYVQFITMDTAGEFWITWDFPLSYNMKMPPELKIYRCLDALTVNELLGQHEEYLRLNEVREKPPGSSQLFDHINDTVIRYNLRIGMLRHYAGGDSIGYSWRGTWFLSRQILREMVTG